MDAAGGSQPGERMGDIRMGWTNALASAAGTPEGERQARRLEKVRCCSRLSNHRLVLQEVPGTLRSRLLSGIVLHPPTAVGGAPLPPGERPCLVNPSPGRQRGLAGGCVELCCVFAVHRSGRCT
jgi:hypothetical protein